MSPKETLPVYSIDLIQELDKHFPEKHPSLSMPDREIWFRAGQRDVVNRLLTLMKKQEEDLEVLNRDLE